MNIVLVYNSRSGSAISLDELTQKMNAHNISIDHTIDITGDYPLMTSRHFSVVFLLISHLVV